LFVLKAPFDEGGKDGERKRGTKEEEGSRCKYSLALKMMFVVFNQLTKLQFALVLLKGIVLGWKDY
jgi:hypothetical protein